MTLRLRSGIPVPVPDTVYAYRIPRAARAAWGRPAIAFAHARGIMSGKFNLNANAMPCRQFYKTTAAVYQDENW